MHKILDIVEELVKLLFSMHPPPPQKKSLQDMLPKF